MKKPDVKSRDPGPLKEGNLVNLKEICSLQISCTFKSTICLLTIITLDLCFLAT
jgi:hypothetical protein